MKQNYNGDKWYKANNIKKHRMHNEEIKKMHIRQENLEKKLDIIIKKIDEATQTSKENNDEILSLLRLNLMDMLSKDIEHIS